MRKRFHWGLRLSTEPQQESLNLPVRESAVIMLRYLISTGSVLNQVLSCFSSVISPDHFPVTFLPLGPFFSTWESVAHKNPNNPGDDAADARPRRQSHPPSQPLLFMNNVSSRAQCGKIVYTESKTFLFWGLFGFNVQQYNLNKCTFQFENSLLHENQSAYQMQDKAAPRQLHPAYRSTPCPLWTRSAGTFWPVVFLAERVQSPCRCHTAPLMTNILFPQDCFFIRGQGVS